MPRILVIGDAMIDRYINATPSRISPEGPAMALSVQSVRESPGGAVNVLQCAQAFGAEAVLCSGPETSIKTRVRATHAGRTSDICRFDEDRYSEPESVPDWPADVILLADYGKGACCERIVAEARRRGAPLLVDPHPSTPTQRYRGADILKMNALEAGRISGVAVDSPDSGIAAAKIIRRKLRAGSVVVTLGAAGAVWADGSDGYEPGIPTTVVDTCGAGDVFAATLAVALARGSDLPAAVRCANRMAAESVQHDGCWQPNKAARFCPYDRLPA
jgi:bifunctional ADP-heptose synthase (sugar kinase/adenylyltransferase)